MKTRYLIKESFRGFNSAKLSAIASTFTISISLTLLAIFVIFSINSNSIIKSIKDKVEIEVFLTDDIKPEEISVLKERIRTIGGVKSITFISKDDAAKIFEEQFGKEMLEIYEYNPLPPSLKINLYDEYKTTDRMNKIKQSISTMSGVSDIKFPEKNLDLIEQNTSGFTFINFIVLIIITISSIFLVSNTIRLIINSRKRVIEILKLLGATKYFIMIPFIIEGFLQGLAGGLMSNSILYIIYYIFTANFKESQIKLEFINTDYLLYIIIIGILLGILGSFFSLKKHLKFKINY